MHVHLLVSYKPPVLSKGTASGQLEMRLWLCASMFRAKLCTGSNFLLSILLLWEIEIPQISDSSNLPCFIFKDKWQEIHEYFIGYFLT